MPAYVSGYDAQLAATPLATWKSYLRYHVADAYASALPKRFADASFAFRSTLLSGVKEQLPRAQRCTAATDASLRDVLGKVYVAKTFPPAAKARALALVDNLQGVLHDDIGTLDWMSAPTKRARGGQARRVHQEDRLPRPLDELRRAEREGRPYARRTSARCGASRARAPSRASASRPTAACSA